MVTPLTASSAHNAPRTPPRHAHDHFGPRPLPARRPVAATWPGAAGAHQPESAPLAAGRCGSPRPLAHSRRHALSHPTTRSLAGARPSHRLLPTLRCPQRALAHSLPSVFIRRRAHCLPPPTPGPPKATWRPPGPVPGVSTHRRSGTVPACRPDSGLWGARVQSVPKGKRDSAARKVWAGPGAEQLLDGRGRNRSEREASDHSKRPDLTRTNSGGRERVERSVGFHLAWVLSPTGGFSLVFEPTPLARKGRILHLQHRPSVRTGSGSWEVSQPPH